jgi:hypothetical protein
MEIGRQKPNGLGEMGVTHSGNGGSLDEDTSEWNKCWKRIYQSSEVKYIFRNDRENRKGSLALYSRELGGRSVY